MGDVTRRMMLAGAAAGVAAPALGQRKAAPALAAEVGADDLGAPDAIGLRDVAVQASPPPYLRRRPPIAGVTTDGADAQLLALHRRGAAAGLSGFLYDNRDRGHSALRLDRFPQLIPLRYDQALKARGLDYALNQDLRFNAPVIGNSSTAITGAAWRSLPRMAMTRAGAMARVAALYGANHLYVYPEHRDHDPGVRDLYPANAPCFIISQGSSGSDRPFLRAVLLALAGLRRDAQKALIRHGVLAHAAQLALRLGQVADRDAYLQAEAHPVVFDAARLNPSRMLAIMQALRADSIPPAPVLEVLAEDAPEDPVGMFGEGGAERLFDVGAAAARLLKGCGARRRYRLGAGRTVDPNGRPLRFIWRVLNGGRHLRLRPLDAAAAEVELELDARDLFDGVRRRLDVALFADNGAGISAPAFFSITPPTHERRTYDAAGRLLRADFQHGGGYVDPHIWPGRPWSDVFQYDGAALLGWSRRYQDGREESYAWSGGRIVRRDAQGRALTAEQMRYPRDLESGRALISPQPDGAAHHFTYDGPGDRIGRFEVAPARR